ncbi:MAG: hypothetical protein VKP62_00155 [Candidatus Sericytochromatia bacterium]|nr:hypothetical protein [Candidatus Sericytochromatia bacterium]
MTRPHPPFRAFLWLLALLFAGGCVLPLGSASLRGEGPVKVTGKARVTAGATGYRLAQAQTYTMTPYVASDIATMDVIIWQSNGSGDLDSDENSVATAFLGSVTGPDAPIVIENLKKEKTYRVRLVAYIGRNETHPEGRVLAQGARFDDESTACITQFSTGLEDFRDGMSFNLRLRNQTFAGEREGTAAITPGVIVDTSSPEQLGN